MKNLEKEKESFEKIKSNFLNLDPASFIENNLTLDGSEFKIIGNGWKFMVDVYRYIGIQATKKNGKPVVIKKGRQVGATMMAAAIDLFLQIVDYLPLLPLEFFMPFLLLVR